MCGFIFFLLKSIVIIDELIFLTRKQASALWDMILWALHKDYLPILIIEIQNK